MSGGLTKKGCSFNKVLSQTCGFIIHSQIDMPYIHLHGPQLTSTELAKVREALHSRSGVSKDLDQFKFDSKLLIPGTRAHCYHVTNTSRNPANTIFIQYCSRKSKMGKAVRSI